MWDMIRRLETERDQVWQLEARTVSMNILHDALHDLLCPNAAPDDAVFHQSLQAQLATSSEHEKEDDEECQDAGIPLLQATLEAEVPTSSSPSHAPQGYSITGGIQTFASKHVQTNAPLHQQNVEPRAETSPTAPWTCPVAITDTPEEPHVTEDAYQIHDDAFFSPETVPIWIAHTDEDYHQIYVPVNALVSDVVYAEEAPIITFAHP